MLSDTETSSNKLVKRLDLVGWFIWTKQPVCGRLNNNLCQNSSVNSYQLIFFARPTSLSLVTAIKEQNIKTLVKYTKIDLKIWSEDKIWGI
jgi:hypothetical protein